MSGSDRSDRDPTVAIYGFCGLAVLGVVALIWAVGWLNGKQAEQRGAQPHSHTVSAKNQAQDRCARLPPGGIFECVYDAVEASEETARAEQDLTAQQRAAWAAMAAALFAFISIPIGAVGLYALWRSLRQSDNALEQTREALARDHPPRLLLPLVQIWPPGNRVTNAPLKPFTSGDAVEGLVRVINQGREGAEIIDSVCIPFWWAGNLPMVRPFDIGSSVKDMSILTEIPGGDLVKNLNPGGMATFFINTTVPEDYSDEVFLYFLGEITHRQSAGSTADPKFHQYTTFCRKYDPKLGRFVPVTDYPAYENQS